MFPQVRSAAEAAPSLGVAGLAGCGLDFALGNPPINLRFVTGGPTMANAAMDRMAD